MADAVADFYRGKQIRVIVRTLPATDYDQYSRLIARFMGKYIPGNPSMIVVNMTGGGGIIAANYMARGRATRRHRDRHRQPGTRRRPGARHVAAAQGQSARVQLDRQCDLLEPAAGHLAHVGRPRRSRTPSSASPPSAPPARARRRCSIPPSTTACSAPDSRSSFGYPRRCARSISRWSAARSRAAAPIRIRPIWRRIRPGFRRTSSFCWCRPASRRSPSCRMCR